MDNGKPVTFLLRNGFVEKLRQVARGVAAGAARSSNEGHSEFHILAEELVAIFEAQNAIQLPFLPLPATCRPYTGRERVRVVRQGEIQQPCCDGHDCGRYRRIYHRHSSMYWLLMGHDCGIWGNER